MDLLALLGLSYLFRRLRRRARDPQGATPPQRVPDPVSSSAVPPKPRTRAHTALLGHAARGLLLATMLILLALIPWPTAWATSAALAPTTLPWRRWVVDNVDVLTVSLVGIALIESPVLRVLTRLHWIGQQLVSGTLHAPRVLWLLIRLAATQARVGYWRCRNWQRQRLWRHQRSVATHS